MTENEALDRTLERLGQSVLRAIKRELEIEPELLPLPSPDDPQYELIRTQHDLARLRQRMRGA